MCYITLGELAWPIHEPWELVSCFSMKPPLEKVYSRSLSTPTFSWSNPFNHPVPTILKWGMGRKKIREIFFKTKSRANVSCLCPYSFLLDPTLFLLAFQRPPAEGLSIPSLSVPTIWGLKEKLNTNSLYSSYQRLLHLGILPKEVFVVLIRPWSIWGILLLGMGKSSLELP